MKTLTNLQKRHYRVRSTLSGSSERPRLSIYRSNKHIFAQIIDDSNGTTLVGCGTRFIAKEKGTKVEKASNLGKELAKKALDKGITKVVFDRGGYKYHGRVKSLADSAREAGLVF